MSPITSTSSESSATTTVSQQSSGGISSGPDLDDFLGPATYYDLPSFKVVGDNIDKEVKTRDMRSDHQNKSFHHFHACAVRDRVNMGEFSESVAAPDPTSVQFDLLFPSKQDENNLHGNMEVLVARTLKKYVPFFKKYGKGVERHIAHQFCQEMSQKSTIVSNLCVLCERHYCVMHRFHLVSSPRVNRSWRTWLRLLPNSSSMCQL